MAPHEYFCDLGNGTFADTAGDPDGDGSGAVYTGPGGYLAAIWGFGNATALAAGDTLWLKGTGDVERLVFIECESTDVSAWAAGDVVRNLTGSGNHWTGVVLMANDDPVGGVGGNTFLWIWLDAAYDVTDVSSNLADGIENTTKAENDSALLDAVAEGVQWGDNSGDLTDGYIKVIGVNSSWVEDETYAVLDGNSVATYGFYIPSSSSNSKVLIKHLYVTRTSSYGWYMNGTVSDDWVLYHCAAILCAAGTVLHRFIGATVVRFRAESNTSYGLKEGQYGYDAMYAFCKASGNGGIGIGGTSSRLTFVGCLSFDNYNNFECDDGTFINCTIDAGSEDGVLQLSATRLRMVGCRVTSNGTDDVEYGVNLAATGWLIPMYSYFGGNLGAGAAANDVEGYKLDLVGNTWEGTDTDQGYMDTATDDYNLDPDEATTFSTAINLDA